MNSENWERLQKEADQLNADGIRGFCDRWVYRLAPFFSSKQRQAGGLYYQYFFSQVEYCHNRIFKRSVALQNLFDKIIDRTRNVGRPDLVTTFFGTRVTSTYNGKLQTKIIDRDKAHPDFSNVQAGFTTQSLRDQAVATNHQPGKEYSLSQVRYDLGKLRAKGLIEKVPGQNRYQLTCVGLNTCALLTKLRSRFFGPLLSLARRSRFDSVFDPTCPINRCYQHIDTALKTLMTEVGISYA